MLSEAGRVVSASSDGRGSGERGEAGLSPQLWQKFTLSKLPPSPRYVAGARRPGQLHGVYWGIAAVPRRRGGQADRLLKAYGRQVLAASPTRRSVAKARTAPPVLQNSLGFDGGPGNRHQGAQPRRTVCAARAPLKISSFGRTE